ncbi:M20 family metallopeptidase [Paenarthrobacter nitroguajacolicus]|uniref:M20 family metallopeptidase n=1 Tax=Paenarthrobacter nitroguajacolicus TaxID=211146 RepID=UPI00248AA4B4|nr:M20 family metallopeptidase [Paenarthrobacter nitroguajacolicus]MDI2035997.1 p-aminobenzoyl-glutamate hydrolase subunit B [Paenarthrobacter nitroguajacolicus]
MMTGPINGSPSSAVVLPARDDIRAILDSHLQRWKPEILDLSHSIHADPELGGEEFRAVKRVQRVLRKAGFTLDEKQPSQSTAFSARFGSGELVVALCVEYDALPAIGHACGHNINAASAVGAALALAAVAGQLDITVKVLGTPAEETTGGKVDLIDEGFFDDVSLAMMAHAAATDVVGGSSLAMGMWDVLFEGRPAHAAAAPAEGVNALDAMVIAQTAIALARQQLPAGSIVSLIVTEGGSAVNVIPERARANVEMRAPNIRILKTIQDKVRRCLEGGAHASGCTLQVTPSGNSYAELRQDAFLSQAYRDAMTARGRDVACSTDPVASTDMGNVSQLVPSIHPMVGYDVRGAAHHTAEFASFGASAGADQAVLDAAFGLAAAACAAAVNPAYRERLLRKTRT